MKDGMGLKNYLYTSGLTDPFFCVKTLSVRFEQNRMSNISNYHEKMIAD